MTEKKQKIYVFGHKNPDTDSICAAVAYAALKNKIHAGENVRYLPRRAGQLSPETEYVLKRFGITAPVYMNDVRPQVKDMNIRGVEGVSGNISLKQAWAIMRSVDIATLPILKENGQLEGLITVGDIAKAYMAVFDNTILSDAKTPYSNIIDALDGEMLVGDPSQHEKDGRVLIAASNIDLMKGHIRESDIVILGNRYEAQLCAIEQKASCMIVCEGAPVSRTIKKLAENSGCAVVSTPYDTYTVARLINQSVPVSYFMRCEGLLTFHNNDFVSEIKGVMTKKRHRDFPVLNGKDKFIGVISRRALLDYPLKKVVLVDHNEIEQAVDGITSAEVVEIIDHHKLGTVETVKPVSVRNQPVGCTSTIIYQMFMEHDIPVPQDIAGILCAAILSDTLCYRSPTCTVADRLSAEALAETAGVETRTLAKEMFRAGSDLQSKSEEEIFFQDFKKFLAGDNSFGVGQIMLLSEEDLEEIKLRMIDYLERARKNLRVDMVFFMLTNIIEQTTLLLYAGEHADDVLEEAFSRSAADNQMLLPDVVSRKKQFIPPLMAVLQQ